ncbi:MAG TPA: glycosyltransferase [Solirubrobacteraceae bacterium]|nr:glycosyltransferase [Solirubrobacteraceae bacterium]
MRRPLFWGSALGAGWILGGYPAALALAPARPWRRGDVTPVVSIVVPAFNEHGTLEAKLRALSELDYPPDRVEVVVAVDEDRALADAAAAALPSARVTFEPARLGKAAALRRALGLVAGEVVILTDANNVLASGSVRAAVAHFADPAVVAVAGRRGEVASAYDRYEDLLRRLETRSGSVAAMSGEFMAVRRDRLPPFPAGIVNDDLWLLCQLVRGGGRVVYERDAASEEAPLGTAAELARRSRIGAGRAMLVRELHGLPPGFAVKLLSHKFGRLALPFLLLAAFGSSVSLARRPRYRALAGLQAAAYGAGGLHAAGLAPGGPLGVPFRVAGQFVVGNVAVAVGVIRAARGRQRVTWTPVR